MLDYTFLQRKKLEESWEKSKWGLIFLSRFITLRKYFRRWQIVELTWPLPTYSPISTSVWLFSPPSPPPTYVVCAGPKKKKKLVSPYIWNAILWRWEVHNRLRACHAFPDCQSPGSYSKVTFFYQTERYTTKMLKLWILPAADTYSKLNLFFYLYFTLIICIIQCL